MFFKKKNKEKKVRDDQIFIDDCKALVENGNISQAISKLENKIKEEDKLGKIFTYLMELYNNQLNESRKVGDDGKIKYYLDKIDSLMKKSKDIVRGR
ncbi:MAG: hypothetical protein Q4B36_08780 [Tissierellia bacterium]|nr:hypothetical protein [Tissierellia bacterium]